MPAHRLFMLHSALIVLLLLCCVPARAQQPAPRPNIIFILADDLGYGDLGCYGQKQILTPSLDKLAAEGLRFTNAYAGATVCAPSRCSLMTGLHGGHARIRGNKEVPLLPEDVTVAEIIKAAGYRTACIGKWGMGNAGTTGVPNKQGFDYFFGYLNQTHAHNYYPEYLHRNEEKITLKNKLPKDAKSKFGEGVSETQVEYSHDLFTVDALRYLGERAQNRQQPFFLYLAYTLPHANNEGKKTGMEVPSDAPYSDKDWPQPEKNRAAMVTLLDRDVGRIMGAVRQLGLDDNTLVIFTSDNGPHNEGGSKASSFQSSGPLRGTKRDLYDGGIRVPFIARWPGKIQPNTTTDFLTAFWDFPATAADLAGAKDKLLRNLDGQSILPTLVGREQPPPSHLYFEFHEKTFDQAVRFGDYKAIRLGYNQPLELYDLKTDLGEANDVAKDHPDVIQRAEKLLAQSRTDSADFPVHKGPRNRKPGTD
jgi:arylsulfatase A-like enzyme